MHQEQQTHATAEIPPAVASAASTSVHSERQPPRFDAAPKGTAADDVSRHKNTTAGDLAFLTRYAFGRY